MRSRPGFVRRLGAALLVAAVASCGRASLNADEPPAATNGRALLVGVTTYPNLGDGYQLHGPANDVLLMKQLLTDKFAFSPENIVILSEEEGKKDEAKLPTRANIEREFLRLGKTARAGEQIVISMSGHGSQQPDRPDSKELKPDGLDEIFLPRDVGKWEDGKEAVANAILDHEVGRWLRPMQDAGASVWVVFDSCHSGTMTRGVGEQARTVPDDAPDGLAIPRQALEAARKRAAERNAGQPATRGGPARTPPPVAPAAAGGVAALYACQSNEVTIERVPDGAADGKSYGLLTYTINKILRRATERPTYNELIQQVEREYLEMGRTAPTPLAEGGDRDREVLGKAVWKGRSRLEVRQGDAGLTVTGGALMGLTPDSVLAVYPPVGQGAADKPVGYVRVGAVRVQGADVRPCDYEGTAAPKPEALVGGRCEPVLVDYGDQRLRVAVDAADFKGKPVPDAERRKLTDVITAMEKSPTAVVVSAATPADAKWLVRWDSGKVYLLPASEWSRADAEGRARSLLGPVPADDAAAEWLQSGLEKIARAEGLKTLAVRLSGEGRRAGADLSAQVGVEVRLHAGENDREGKPLAANEGPPLLYDGDFASVRLTNPGHVAVDVTVLYVDSGYGITALFPRAAKGEDNRLKPGDVLNVDLDIDGTTAGMENIVVIAVKGEGQSADFGALAQPSIEAAVKDQRSRGADPDRGLKSPVGKLLQQALYGEGGTRAVHQHKAQDYVLQCLPWQIEPGKRPAGGK